MMLSFQGKTSGEEAQPFWGDAVLGRRQRQAGFKSGDRLEVKAMRGLITIAAKPEAAENEHTPEQRRKINAQLAEGLADLKAGKSKALSQQLRRPSFFEPRSSLG